MKKAVGKKMNIEPNQLISPKENRSLEEIRDDGSSLIAFLWLFVFSLMMFTLPFLTFFGVKDWLKESYDVTGFQNNCYSVLASVIVVNIVICLYVWKAFTEKITPIKKNE